MQASVLYVSKPSERLAKEHAARRRRLARLSPRPIAEVVSSIVEVTVPRRRLNEVGDVERIKMIQRATVHFYPDVTVDDLISACHQRSVVMPRQIAMYLCKTLTNRSYPDIGRRFGGRHHTTILHATRKIGRLCREDEGVARDVARIKSMLEEGV